MLAAAACLVAASLTAGDARADDNPLLPDNVAGFVSSSPSVGDSRSYNDGGSISLALGLLTTPGADATAAARLFVCSQSGKPPLLGLAATAVQDASVTDVTVVFLVDAHTYLAVLSSDDSASDLAGAGAAVITELRRQLGEPATLTDRPPDPELSGFLPSVDGLDASSPGCSPPTLNEDELLAAGSAQQFLARHITEASRLYFTSDKQEVLSVSLTKYPYAEVAAFAPLAEQGSSPLALTGVPTDARAWSTARGTTERTVVVAFRRARIGVLILGQGGADPAADVVVLARAVARLLPPGESKVETFPSPARTLGTSGGLLAAGALLLSGGRAAVGLDQRRRLGSGSRQLPPPNVAVVDRQAARSRRRGVALLAVQWTCLVGGLTGSMLEIGWWRPVVLGAAVAVGMAITAVVRRAERSAEVATTVAGAAPAIGLATASVLVLASGAALLVRGLRDRFDRLSITNLQLADRFSVAPHVLAFAEMLVGVVLLVGGVVALRSVRRRARRTVAQERAADRRAPVLYLRSFDDDDLPLPGLPSARRPFLDALSLRLREPFEEAVAWQLEAYGPVIAVGRPGRTLASLGAAREHLEDAVWQPQVAQRMSEAAWIVVAIGSTPGLGWELRRVVADGHLAKTIFLTPPVPREARAQRWRVTAEVLASAGALLPPIDPAECLTVRLSGGSTKVAATARRWDEAAYRAAIAATIMEIPTTA